MERSGVQDYAACVENLDDGGSAEGGVVDEDRDPVLNGVRLDPPVTTTSTSQVPGPRFGPAGDHRRPVTTCLSRTISMVSGTALESRAR